ncbi:hypothetical protein [Streptomyces showdoensis]|uniref:PH domain-containing protein n=1 Tax=Streptomyces showdoensis TaxID=68268 RepID=A0A2P2GKY7_STREW|nr:hypothetical protein [Streptomyces showdoensis]KKZ71465.1 hypothetical protein VO63_23275 [Streptomyces showdoensis]
MRLLPTTPNRCANTIPGVAPAVLLAVHAAESGAGWALAAALASLVFAVRGWRLGVRCEPGRLVVHGYLRTRRIDRSRITGVTDFPAVRWTAPGGRERWTPVLAFLGTSEETAGTRRRKRENVARLRRWAAGRR